MDNRANALHEMFSRGATPPATTPPSLQQFGPAIPGPVTAPSSNQIDSLFQNIGNTSEPSQPVVPIQSDNFSNSSPTISLLDAPGSLLSSGSSSSAQRQNSQNALLSLIGSPQVSQPRNLQPLIPQLTSESQRSEPPPSSNEAQGKILLETLMSGQPISNYSDSQRGSQGAAPSPPFSQTGSQRDGPYLLQDPAIESAHRAGQPSQLGLLSIQHPAPPPPPAQQQQDPPSPRRSMFDFVSPFDALTAGKKKAPPPPPQASTLSSGTEDSSSWTAVDPKRQSVDNLLEHLTRQTQPQPSSYEQSTAPYLDYVQAEQSRSLPLQPANKPAPPPHTSSPQGGSPMPQVQTSRAPGRYSDSPSSQQGNGRRDKESSPGPRGGSIRGAKGGKQNKNQVSPTHQVQNIIFDVSLSLNEIQAPVEYVKSTAIALVRQDPVFLPGTTIGATHWVAYAMTRGRVRVISRSSGDRTLLQLPNIFPNTSSVSDMAVNGNRLAGVTNDGGFVIWELPEVITDDVPGQLIFCVPPSHDSEALLSVKWHPKEPETLAVASENQIYLIDLANTYALHGQTLGLSDLHHLGHVFSIPSPIIAFDFDILHYAIATISVDSTLTIWNINDSVPYATHKLRGEDMPSSLTFVDNGIVVGRKNGTIIQLLSNTNKNVLSTIKFVNGTTEDPDMFGHVSYDSRIQTLWVANSRRDSMVAIRLNPDPSMSEDASRGYFDQIVEFSGPKPTIHFVILTADSDPTGDEAYAACVAAKQPPGDLALVAFSVHSTGVDQILIRKEWFDTALVSTLARHPNYSAPPQPTVPEAKRPVQAPPHPLPAPPRGRSPPSEEVEAEIKDESRLPESKPKGPKGGKNVNFKDRENKEDSSKENNKGPKSSDAPVINESALSQVLTKEIRKTEENLHTRIGRLLGKELDKQHQRFEEIRAHEQVEDFARQEKILKLISNELTRNTTRVVEMAVKSEVQNSVLPALENITKTELKSALHDQLSRVLVDALNQSLPNELEKLLLRPDLSPHISRLISSGLSPVIEHHVKDTLTKTLVQQSTALHQELLNEFRSDMHKMKSEIAGWQSETIRAQEASIRDLDRTVRALADQIKFLTMSPSSAPGLHHLPQPAPQHSGSPGSSLTHTQGPLGVSHLRQNANIQPQQAPQPPQGYNTYQQPPQQSQPVPQQQWFNPAPIAAPQASHPATMPQAPPPPQSERTPPVKSDQWDEIYLSVLHTQETNKLKELLARTNPDLIMPLNGTPLVSQAVVLTLCHRLSAVVGETPPSDDAFKTSLWWLQRAVTVLRPEDTFIADFIPRVVPNVQLVLNTTKQRLAILPGGPHTIETARTISDVQDMLRRKAPLP